MPPFPTSTSSIIPPPEISLLLSPLLSSLPAASISPQPPAALLPLLSPILRQRVQLLSQATKDPWLPLLSYNTSESTSSKLEALVKNERFEPHPVSGEVEIDWEGEEGEVDVQYKRVDEETLQSLVTLKELGLVVRLVYCVNDEGGGGDGWRIGEVLVADSELKGWGVSSIAQAEASFSLITSSASGGGRYPTNGKPPTPGSTGEEEDEDDDYWAQYDNTPAQTPGPTDTRHSTNSRGGVGGGDSAGDEESYYAQYSSVQPAMDNHDPDEAHENGPVESTLGGNDTQTPSTNPTNLHGQSHDPELHSTSEAWSSSYLPISSDINDPTNENNFITQPRPTSSHGSSGSDTVARLEKVAADEEGGGVGGRETSEMGIKQHIGTSIKSLWRLAKVVGMEREEFERVVRTELECIGMMDEDD